MKDSLLLLSLLAWSGEGEPRDQALRVGQHCTLVAHHPDGVRIYRYPLSGNDTVLDALGRAPGRLLWAGCKLTLHRAGRTLPVDWQRITQQGDTATNYVLLPGDRIVLEAMTEAERAAARPLPFR